MFTILIQPFLLNIMKCNSPTFSRKKRPSPGSTTLKYKRPFWQHEMHAVLGEER